MKLQKEKVMWGLTYTTAPCSPISARTFGAKNPVRLVFHKVTYTL